MAARQHTPSFLGMFGAMWDPTESSGVTREWLSATSKGVWPWGKGDAHQVKDRWMDSG